MEQYFNYLSRLGACATLCVLLSSYIPPATPPPVQVIDYQGPDTSEALSSFIQQKVPAPRQTILFFFTDWCTLCRHFPPLLKDEQVAGILQQTTVVNINVDKCQQLAATYHVNAIPAFLKINAQGKVMSKATGDKWKAYTPDATASLLHELVAGHQFDVQK